MGMMLKYNCIEKQVCDRLHVLKAYIKSRCNGQHEQAEDIYSDAVLKIFKIIRQGKYREGGKVNAFMLTCVRSVMCDYYRKNNVTKRIYNNEYEGYFRMFTKSHEKQYEIQVEIDIFMKKMDKIKNDYKKILILSLFQNMDHYEIADSLGVGREMVSTCMFRMRKELGNAHLNKARERAT